MLNETRERQADAQSHLVASLMRGGSAPTGFDADDLSSTSRSLLSKRYRLVQNVWPIFEASLGERFHPLFDEYAREMPLPIEAQARQDACQFARWLMNRRQLPDLCHLVLLHAELRGIAQPRRGVSIRFAWLSERRRPAFGFKLPGCAPWVVPSS
ncbi:MAG TPA: hypothetical protein PLN21_12130 [Gemmatales bacterium]|nr:hypothetical protein [Gemmatales bacterium]